MGPQHLIKLDDPMDKVYKNKLILKVQTINYHSSSHCVSMRHHQLISESAENIFFSCFKCMFSVVHNIIMREHSLACIRFCTTPHSVNTT